MNDYALYVCVERYRYPTQPLVCATLDFDDGKRFVAKASTERAAIRDVRRKAKKWRKYGPESQPEGVLQGPQGPPGPTGATGAPGTPCRCAAPTTHLSNDCTCEKGSLNGLTFVNVDTNCRLHGETV